MRNTLCAAALLVFLLLAGAPSVEAASCSAVCREAGGSISCRFSLFFDNTCASICYPDPPFGTVCECAEYACPTAAGQHVAEEARAAEAELRRPESAVEVETLPPRT